MDGAEGTARVLAERNPPTRRVPCLVVLTGREAGRVLAIARGEHILGRGPGASLRLEDPAISRRHARLIARASRLEAEDLGSTNGLWWNGQRVPRAALLDGDRLQLGDCRLAVRWSGADEGRLWRQLYLRATRDALTGLHNRPSLEERLARELERHGRYRRGLALLVLDLDRFKSLNDAHGHAAGDAVLRATGQVLRAQLRASDLAARVGGEEFVVLLPECDPAQAREAAEKLRRELAGLEVAGPGGARLRVTASVGVALAGPAADSPAALLARADAACYRAKQGGRDRVCCAPPAGGGEPVSS
ncbi:MAG TPA: GGDEF domain-containing protein [Myxococcota bacterium]|nr:GGDEF domain-containing protein [Myxococcota bacterium]HRY95928.1 GGDEF domain-containing protein [Myxococcota bacterium]HSA24372.1 GGDEF domain-containing protein [Myxococcota bacterium]